MFYNVTKGTHGQKTTRTGKESPKTHHSELRAAETVIYKNDRELIYSSAAKVTFLSSYLHKTVIKKLNIKCNNKNVLPKRTEKQNGYPENEV